MIIMGSEAVDKKFNVHFFYTSPVFFCLSGSNVKVCRVSSTSPVFCRDTWMRGLCRDHCKQRMQWCMLHALVSSPGGHRPGRNRDEGHHVTPMRWQGHMNHSLLLPGRRQAAGPEVGQPGQDRYATTPCFIVFTRL